MTREEAIEEINKVFEPAFANYIITALTEGATASDKALKQEPCEDAVSRADTLQSFESYCEKNCQYSKKQRDVMCGACMMGDAIEIVESLPPTTPKPLASVLDEIKAEFKSKADGDDWYHTTDGLVWEEAIEIIDKHRKGEEDGRLLGMRKCKYPNV